MNKIGRNDKCICGSGKKYKICCINKTNIEENRLEYFCKPVDINNTFNKILKELDNVYLMSDILEISATNDITVLFSEFKKRFGRINNEYKQRYELVPELVPELFYRIEAVKKRIGKEHLDWYKGIFVITNISEYIDVLSKIKKIEGNKELWYRGQIDASYSLCPNIYRNAKEISTPYGNDINPKSVSWDRRGQQVIFPNIKRMLEDLKERLKEKVKFEINNDFEWMFLGQHYGMLTPLLDWSEDPLVGLFFAMDGLSESNSYDIDQELNEFERYGRISNAAAVYTLNPGELNKYSNFYHVDENENKKFLDYPVKINDSNMDVFRGYIDGEQFFPLCIKAPKREYRICRQSGNFVCLGRNIQPIDSYNICRDLLYKIYIPYGSISTIKRELEILNITPEAIYGEKSYMDDYANEIRVQEEENFKTLIGELKQKYEENHIV